MRRLILSLVLVVAYGGSALAAPCMRPAEVQAFDIIGLKSALMVGALSCSQRNQYDTFMTEFQPHILFEQHVMDAYFRRTGGHYGQEREDDYVTLLANSQSEQGIAQGAVYCQSAASEFTKVLDLKTIDSLNTFAASNPTPQPISLTLCRLHTYHHSVVRRMTVAETQTATHN